MARTKTQPRFKVGERVYVSLLNKECEISRGPSWNGLMWMYSFVGEQLSCGEIYLRSVKVAA